MDAVEEGEEETQDRSQSSVKVRSAKMYRVCAGLLLYLLPHWYWVDM